MTALCPHPYWVRLDIITVKAMNQIEPLPLYILLRNLNFKFLLTIDFPENGFSFVVISILYIHFVHYQQTPRPHPIRDAVCAHQHIRIAV